MRRLQVLSVQRVLVLLRALTDPIGFRPTIVLPRIHPGTTLRLGLRQSVVGQSVLGQSVLRGPDCASRHWAEHWSW